jgi:flagellin-like protein
MYLMASALFRRRGLAGLDALIIFIAIVLAAAVVAMLLSSTNMSLTRRAQAVESEKRRGMQAPIVLEAIRGRDVDGDHRLDELVATIRIQESSEPIRLNETLILVNSKATNCTSLSYAAVSGADCKFTVSYGKKGSRFEEGYLAVGDIAYIHMSGATLYKGVEDGNAAFTFVPAEGFITEVKFNIPARITQPNTGLWPLND